MGRAINGYLMAQKTLQEKGIGPKKVIRRVARLFAIITIEQAERLEHGVNLRDDEQDSLAASLGEQPFLVGQDLENFLFWRRNSGPFPEAEHPHRG